MEVFRISMVKYANELISSGVSNRWNMDGQYVLYAGESRSLSALELIVNRGAIKSSLMYKVMVITIPDDDKWVEEIKLKYLESLHVDWRNTNAYLTLQAIGSEWYRKKEALILKTPSAIIPKEYNFVINTSHHQFHHLIKLTDVEDYIWDNRLM